MLFSGVHQLAVRWYTVRASTSSRIVGTTCTPLDEVPMTATRLPVKSTGSAGHRPVWCWTPRNCSLPGTSGRYGTESTPVAATRNRRARRRPVVRRHGPGARGLVVHRRGDAGAEPHVAPQVEPVDHVVEVALDLGLLGEVLLPLPFLEQLLREQVAVGVALRVEPCPGVAVPVPRAAHAVAGFDQPRGEAGFEGAVQLVDAGDARADDQHVDGGRRADRRRRRERVRRSSLYRPVSISVARAVAPGADSKRGCRRSWIR